MTDAPERIALKLTEGYEVNWWGEITDLYDDEGVEYIRADLHEKQLTDARIAGALMAIEAGTRRIAELMISKPSDVESRAYITGVGVAHDALVALNILKIVEDKQ